MKGLFLIICMSAFLATASGQQKVIDSLNQILQALPPNRTKVDQLNQIVEKLQNHDPDMARIRVDQSITLSTKLNYKLGLAIAYRLKGVLFVDKLILDSGKFFYDKAFNLTKSSKDKSAQKQIGLLTHNYGVIFHHQQRYDSATEKYLKAAKIFTDIGDDGLAYFPYTNLAAIYSFLKDGKKALHYAQAALASATLLSDLSKIVSAKNSVISMKMEIGDYDSVLTQLQENLIDGMKREDYYQVGKSQNLIAQYYANQSSLYDSSIRYCKLSFENMKKINNLYEEATMLHNIGYYYSMNDEYDSAIAYLQKAILMGKSAGLDHIVQYSLANMVDTHEKAGHISAAFQSLKDYLVVKDSVILKNNQQQVNELETRFQSKKKELQISQLEAEAKIKNLVIQKKNTLALLSLGIIISLALLALLIHRNYKQKQRIQQQRITELEMEQALTTTEAILKGEEKERARLSKDLHDGLGGLLSGVKYSLHAMKGNLIMTPDNSQAFERSLDMLDSSIKEMRRVAHNMMPESLVHFGLDLALKDFCNEIDESGILTVSYQSIGLRLEDLDNSKTIAIYRIVQELINNTIKHAAAKMAIVQLTQSNGVLSLTVEDDGNGFDVSKLENNKGMGWTNIQHRVKFLKGKLDTHSQPGKGTSIHIEFNI